MRTLLVGFDSAWSGHNRGALAAVVRDERGAYLDLGEPQVVGFREAACVIEAWQAEHRPASALVLIDQPTIVENATGRRPVEHIVAPSITRRGGGMQPANTGRAEMFGQGAPIWTFLERFGGAANPDDPVGPVRVFETYPALALVALGWTLERSGRSGRMTRRLPKYNPERQTTFRLSDWRYVCERAREEMRARGLDTLAGWLARHAANPSPRKRDQDGVDACLCLLVGLCAAEEGQALVVGDVRTGYILAPVPRDAGLATELENRCSALGWPPETFVRLVRVP